MISETNDGVERWYESLGYEVVKYQALRRFRCAFCGKRVERIRTFTQTLNPRNRTRHGHAKTYDEARDELRDRGQRWAAQLRLVCTQCDVSIDEDDDEYA